MLAVGDLMGATIVSVLAYAGLRPGEAVALERFHVRNDTLLIEQAVANGKLKLQKTGRVYRTVDLLSALADDLAVWLELLPADQSALFLRDDGGLWRTTDWNNFRKRRFYVATEAAGVGRPRPYDLRHSFASLRIREKELSIVELAAGDPEDLRARLRRAPARPSGERRRADRRSPRRLLQLRP